MDPHHRKIDLQSPQDLIYLRTNIQAAAQQKVDLQIPPSADNKGEDVFRTKVEELVHQYIQQTLTLALPSLSINGLDASPTLFAPSRRPSDDPSEEDSNYEPYDSRLATKLRILYATLESETTRVAELRREAPAAAARAYMERLQQEMEVEERELSALRERVASEGEKEGGKGLVDLGVEREGEVRVTWKRGLEGLMRLKGMTEEVARLERAKEVAGIVERV